MKKRKFVVRLSGRHGDQSIYAQGVNKMMGYVIAWTVCAAVLHLLLAALVILPFLVVFCIYAGAAAAIAMVAHGYAHRCRACGGFLNRSFPEYEYDIQAIAGAAHLDDDEHIADIHVRACLTCNRIEAAVHTVKRAETQALEPA